MNRFFGEIPTALPRTPEIEALHLARVALVFATGEVRAARLEVCSIPESSNIALSAKLEQIGDNPRDGLLQYLTHEGVEGIHPDPNANAVGANLSLVLATA